MYHPQQNYNSTRLQTVKYSLFGPFINPRGRITLRTPGLYLQTVQCVNRCVLLSISSPCNMQQYSHFINIAQQMPNGLTESSAITAKWRFKSLSTPPHTHTAIALNHVLVEWGQVSARLLISIYCFAVHESVSSSSTAAQSNRRPGEQVGIWWWTRQRKEPNEL